MKTQLLLLVMVLCMTVKGNSQIFYAVLVADTRDANIGESCKIDQNAMIAQVNTIALTIGYKPVIKIIAGNSFQKTAVLDTLQRLMCTPADIILFHYSGHGVNETARNTPYPSLAFMGNFFPLNEVHDLLKTKNARLCITLGDCCNELYRAETTDPRGFVVVENNNNVQKVYNNLFRDVSGDILASACAVEQYACGDNTNGGIFTNQCIEALQYAANYSTEVSWHNLMSDVRNRVSRFTCNGLPQTPQFDLQIAETPPPPPNDISFVQVNKYFNDIIDMQINRDQRRALSEQSSSYFTPKARVDIYDSRSTIRTAMMSIEEFSKTLYLNAENIQMVNLIENKSVQVDGVQQFKVIAVQRIWKKN